jgi:Uma2 family endonuclease
MPVEYPKMKHYLLRTRISELLGAAHGKLGVSGTSMPFRPAPEYEFRVADVGWLSPERAKRACIDDDVFGSPEFVVDVLYPSKTHDEAVEKRDLCFSSGCEEFWIIDGALSFIEVAFADGRLKICRTSERIAIAGVQFEASAILDRNALVGGPK